MRSQQAFAALALALMPELALAQSPVAALTGYLQETFFNSQVLAIGIAAIVAIGIGVSAFAGKFNWRWFFAFLGSLALIAGVGTLLTFINEGDTTIVTEAEETLNSAGSSLSVIAYGLAAIGIMALAVLAMFSTRFRWGWMWAILGGLALIAGFDNLLAYIDSDGQDYAQVAPVENIVSSLQGNLSAIAYGIAALGAMVMAVLLYFDEFEDDWVVAWVAGIIIIAGFGAISQFIGGSELSASTPPVVVIQ